jgi:putative membrane protein
MTRTLVRVFSLALLLVPFAVVAQMNSAADPLFQSRLLNSLHEGNLQEIAAGRLAITRGATPAIRQFGAELVQDHSTADGELVILAANLNVVLPAAAAPQDGLDALSNLSGRAFDRAFAKMMLDDHDKALALVRSAQPNVKNGQLSAYLEKLLPVLERHRATANTLNQAFQS